MDIKIEVDNSRVEIGADGIKIYGSAEELRQIAEAIEEALRKGLVQGWVGVGIVNPKTVFPFNGLPTVPTKAWGE